MSKYSEFVSWILDHAHNVPRKIVEIHLDNVIEERLREIVARVPNIVPSKLEPSADMNLVKQRIERIQDKRAQNPTIALTPSEVSELETLVKFMSYLEKELEKDRVNGQWTNAIHGRIQPNAKVTVFNSRIPSHCDSCAPEFGCFDGSRQCIKPKSRRLNPDRIFALMNHELMLRNLKFQQSELAEQLICAVCAEVNRVLQEMDP